MALLENSIELDTGLRMLPIVSLYSQ